MSKYDRKKFYGLGKHTENIGPIMNWGVYIGEYSTQIGKYEEHCNPGDIFEIIDQDENSVTLFNDEDDTIIIQKDDEDFCFIYNCPNWLIDKIIK